jgi:fatty-acyl-CoA synthase
MPADPNAASTPAATSYSKGPVEPPLLEETIGANLERIVAEFGAEEALVELASGRRWTYREFDADVDATARALLAIGVEVGDRIGIWAPNCAEWTLVQYASAKIGAILVTINPAYRTSELSFAINQSGLRVLLAASAFRSSDYASMIGQVRPECPGLDQVVFVDTADWKAFLVSGRAVPPTAVHDRMAGLRPEDPINIQYTSGTTGFPKGATLSHRNILNNGFMVTELIGFGPDDRLAIPVPFYHCFGMVMGNLGCTSHGSTMVIPGPGFDPALTLRAIQDERCTGVYGVPTMFIAMQSHPDFETFDLTSLRTGLMAGSPCPVEVMRRCVSDMHMSQVGIAYGMTETSPVSTQTRMDDDLDRRTSTIGRVHPHVEIKVVDPVSGETRPWDEPGELCTRGYSVMLGYWEQPERTAEAIDADGWMHTGDLATLRADGYANIVGRIKDMIIRGGENVYPREIEEFLYTHPDIEDVQVIGVPDLRYGEEICAWIKMRADTAPLDVAAVRAFAEGRLAHFKIPRYVMIVDEFPLTVTGKVRKVDMREASIRELGLHPIGTTA